MPQIPRPDVGAREQFRQSSDRFEEGCSIPVDSFCQTVGTLYERRHLSMYAAVIERPYRFLIVDIYSRRTFYG